MYNVKNAIIMAAGTSSRFTPLSYDTHKGLISVRGEILVERQIRQLKEAGINDIIIVTGYKSEQFDYLIKKFDVKLIHNPDYLIRNNHSSINVVREYIDNSYICSVDNYFLTNPFTSEVEDSYYASVYVSGATKEWCLKEDGDGFINYVEIGGFNSWIMLGHTFWTKEFADNFFKILDKIYNDADTINLLWESIYMKHLDILKMKIQKYPDSVIFEFDNLDELREFDKSYIDDTRSSIVKNIAKQLDVKESDMNSFTSIKDNTNESVGFEFIVNNTLYNYLFESKELLYKGELKNVGINKSN